MFYIGFFIKKMSDLLIQSFLVSDVSKSLRSLTKNEQCERIAQVTHQKWATMSESLRSLRVNERLWANRSGRSPKMSEWANRSFFEWITHSLIFGQKTSDLLRKPMSEISALVKNKNNLN